MVLDQLRSNGGYCLVCGHENQPSFGEITCDVCGDKFTDASRVLNKRNAKRSTVLLGGGCVALVAVLFSLLVS